MGIAERHERERNAMRRRILDAARALFVAEGFGNVSIRKIADRIEYSPSAIYGYFINKDEILIELAEEGFRELERFTEPRVTSDPVADLRHDCLRYYAFSKSHPEYFSLMFLENVFPMLQDREQFTFLAALRERGVRQVQRCVDAGAFPPSTNVEVANGLLWAGIHGPSVIGLTWGAPMADQVDELAVNVVDAAVAGLTAGAGVRAADSAPPNQALRDAGVSLAGERS